MEGHLIHKWIYSVPHEMYANLCMTSFNISMEALWSAVGLNENEFPQRLSQMLNLYCVYKLRGIRFFIHVILRYCLLQGKIKTYGVAGYNFSLFYATLK